MMRVARTALRIGLLAVALAAFAGGAAAGDRLTVPGTAISMEVPDGFVLARDFSGFQNMKTGASIAVTVFADETHPQLAAVISSVSAANEAFANEGIVLTEGEALPMTAGGVMLVLHGTQKVGSLTLDKWMALAGPGPTALFTFNLAEDTKPEAAAVRASLASVQFGEPPSIEEQLAALPYTMQASEPFRITAVMGGAAVAMATIDGPDATGKLPLVVVGWQIGGQQASSAAAIAEPLLRSTIGLADAVVETTLPVRLAGAVGVKLGGTFDRNGTAMAFVQYVAVLNGQSVRVLATMKADEAATLLPVIDTIARSVTRR